MSKNSPDNLRDWVQVHRRLSSALGNGIASKQAQNIKLHAKLLNWLENSRRELLRWDIMFGPTVKNITKACTEYEASGELLDRSTKLLNWSENPYRELLRWDIMFGPTVKNIIKACTE